MRATRAILALAPGLEEVLATDWRKAARFYARFGVTEVMLRHGVQASGGVLSGPIEDATGIARREFYTR